MRPRGLVPILLGCIVAAAAFPSSAKSQTQGEISGSVLFQETNQPAPAATITLRRASDSTVVAGTLTDARGQFRLENLPSGRYALEVSSLGRTPYRLADIEITSTDATHRLEPILLAASAVELEGIVATGQALPVRVTSDRTIYSVQEMPVAAGGFATDVLRNVPDIEVDVEGKITAMGATPAVHLNGRPAPMQGEALTIFLQNLPADRIDRIEYISNPSARYEAEGQGGILNIVLKENASLGLSGSVSANTGTRGQNGFSGRLNLQQGRLTLFGGSSVSIGRDRSSTFDLRENRVADPITFLQQSGETSNSRLFGGGDMTLEWKLTPRTTIWSGVRGSLNGSEMDGTMNVLHMDEVQNPTDRYDRVSASEWSYFSGYASLGLRNVKESQRDEYSLEVRYTRNGQDNDNLVEKHLRELANGDPLAVPPFLTEDLSNQDEGNLTVQADLAHPWGEGGKFELGYRGSFRDLSNTQHVQSDDPDSPTPGSVKNAFEHTENFNSVYLTADRTVGKAGIQLGLRVERADTRFVLPLSGDSFENDYTSLFPSVNLSYSLGAGRQVRLSYSRRLDRPPPSFLNPISPVVDPYNRFAGNPSLKPQYTHSINFETSWNGSVGSVRLAPYYRRTTNVWDQLREVDADGVSTVSMYNLASSETYGTGFSLSLRQRGPFSGLLSVQGFRTVRDASNISANFSGTTLSWSTNGNLSIRATPTFSVQLAGFYYPEREVPQGTISSMYYSTLGVRKQFFSNKAALNVSVIDPFDMYDYSFITRDQTHQQTSRGSYSMRRASLSFSYSFGRPPESARRTGTGEVMDQPVDTGGGIR